jgi:serine/threonine protein kinase
MSEHETRPAAGSSGSLDDLLDGLVAEYADQVAAGRSPDREALLARAPAAARPALERCLKMIDAGSATPGSPPRPLVPGLRLGRYELVRELGRGGMAAVWLARDTELARPVALKCLRPGLALEPRQVDRFRREALAVARLRHPHVVQVHEVGESHGHHWIAMELVEGPSFARVLEALPPVEGRGRRAEDLARAAGLPALAAGAVTWEQAVARLLAPVVRALEAAHALGLVHRDVKPANILIDHDGRDGRAVIADFGLAKGGDEPSLSLSGEPLGTPYYMSPEQAYLSGHVVDHRTDVYSLGVTLYEAFGGSRPFDGRSALEVLEAIKTTLPPPLRGHAPWISKDGQAVARRAMARLPEERYQSAAELAEDLERLAEARPTAARRAEGGPVRRAWTSLRFATSGQTYEYRSARTLLGWPLVHVHGGLRPAGSPPRVARGWIALGGERAIGFFAGSRVSVGVIATGAIACGGFAWGALGLGVIAFAGLGLGWISFAGLSVGWLAFGGAAFGYAAIGGLARGVYAMGGDPAGRHVIGGGRADPEAKAYFLELLPDALQRYFGLGG